MPSFDDKPNSHQAGWEHIDTKRIYKSKWFNLRQDKVKLPNNREIDFTYVEQPGAVFIVPVTPSGNIILFRQYRYTIDNWCWEIVAGGMGDKGDKTLEQAAKEEVLEELGGRVGKLESIGSFSTANGITNICTNYFIGYDTILDQPINREATEIITEVKEFSTMEALQMVYSGQVSCSEDALGIILAAAKLERL